jgi:uncharacterized protein involved in outer membrane biogenesis
MNHNPHSCVSPRAHRRLRRLTIALAIVIAIPAAAILAVVFGLNALMRTTAESLASSALKVPVVMDRARVNLAGILRLERLAVGNPLQFKELRAFRVDVVAAEVSLASAFKDTIEVNELAIVHPRMIVEAGKEQLNWSVIMDHLTQPAKEPVEKAKRKEVTFIIRRLRIVRPTVVVRSPKMSRGGTEIVLRDIQLRGVGSAPGSAAPLSLVLATVFQAILTGAIDEWGDIPGGQNLAGITSGASKAYGDRLRTAE